MQVRPTLRLLLTTASLLGCGSTVVTPPPPADASVEDRGVPVESDTPPTPVDVAAPDVVAADVTPTDVPAPDVVTPDVAAPTGPCVRATSLTPDAISIARMERVDDGFVVAWVPGNGNDVVVRSFTDGFVPRAEPLTLSLQLTNGTDTLTLSFAGERGVLAAGSSFFFLTRAADGRLTMTGRHDYPRRLVRWAAAVTPMNFHGLLADGAYVSSNGERMSANMPNAALSPPHGPSVSVRRDPTGGGYFSFETREMAGARRLHARRFIFGHGASLEVTNRDLDDASASPVVESDGALYRLIYRGAREVDVLLERRDPATLDAVGAPTPVHAGAAWISADGALAAAGAELFMAWSARPMNGGYNSALRTRWRSERESAEVHRNDRDSVVRVFDAEADPAATRGWVLFGERDATGRHALLVRCVERGR